MGEDYSGYTTEQLEQLYKKYLTESIVNLREGTRNNQNYNATSRLEDTSGHRSNMGSNQSVENLRADMTVAMQRKHGLANFTGNRTYAQIIEGIVRGDYRKKQPE